MKKYEIYLLYERCYDILFIINIGVEKGYYQIHYRIACLALNIGF